METFYQIVILFAWLVAIYYSLMALYALKMLWSLYQEDKFNRIDEVPQE